jgi:hypothetical protein
MAHDSSSDKPGADRDGVYEGTPGEQRDGGETPAGAGVYSGTPDQPGRAPEGDYGPLGWADVPGKPSPDVAQSPEGGSHGDAGPSRTRTT